MLTVSMYSKEVSTFVKILSKKLVDNIIERGLEPHVVSLFYNSNAAVTILLVGKRKWVCAEGLSVINNKSIEATKWRTQTA